MRRLVLVIALSACVSAGPRPPPPTSYDFGLAASPIQVHRKVPGSLAVEDVVAPEWLSGEGIVYRLAYEDAARPAVYSRSRWLAPPADLFSHRLLQRLADIAERGVMRQTSGVPADHTLRVELEEFAQVFDAPGKSRAVVRIRANLMQPDGTLQSSEAISVEKSSEPDAVGAAKSLREAADEAIDRVAKWTVEELVGEKKRPRAEGGSSGR